MSGPTQPTLPLEGLSLKHTIASKRGDQWVEQCMWCGSIVVVAATATRPTPERLGPCPVCEARNWQLQRVPSTGLAMIHVDKETSRD